MKICILFASPRQSGNTAQLLAPVKARLAELGHELQEFSLYQEDIRPCIACRSCQKDWTVFGCVHQDGMQRIFDAILQSELLILASPVYSWSWTAPMKASLDRLVYGMNKYYGEELQKSDLTIAGEIVINEPEVLEDTVITDNAALVIHFARINPEIVLYISEDLKNDGEFIEELLETGNKEAISYAIKECDISAVLQDNPELASNPEFMKEAIKEDANALKYVDENFKNDYKFMKEVSKENKEVIHYVVGHTQEFGKEAQYIPDFNECVSYLKSNVEAGDIVLTLGAGTVTKISDMLIK